MPRRSPLLVVRELTPARWSDLETLFGDNGACGGCWCMWWRQEKGERWDQLKGRKAKRRFHALVAAKKAHGVIAYAGKDPVGWCAFDRRSELPKLDRAPSLACDDAAEVWSLPCFYVKAGARGQGVATALLAGALDALARRGAHTVEAYPSKVTGKTAAAFVYTGVPALFERAGFACVAPRPRGRQRYRRPG